MNLIDLMQSFEAEFEFTGDSECDYNELTIRHITGDGNIQVKEIYMLGSHDIDNLEEGLIQMLYAIKQYKKR